MIGLVEDIEALDCRVPACPHRPEAVRVRICSCFGDRLEGEQMQGLLRSIKHGRDA